MPAFSAALSMVVPSSTLTSRESMVRAISFTLHPTRDKLRTNNIRGLSQYLVDGAVCQAMMRNRVKAVDRKKEPG